MNNSMNPALTRARLRALLPVFGLSLTISLLVTAVVTYLNIGADPAFVSRWLRAALFACLVMLPLGSVVISVVSRLVEAALAQRRTWLKRLVSALVMGLTMEAIVSALATLTNVGLNAQAPAAWAHAYVRALPLGLCIGLFMGFVARPWIQARMARAAHTALT
jgi:hypothetical protein